MDWGAANIKAGDWLLLFELGASLNIMMEVSTLTGLRCLSSLRLLSLSPFWAFTAELEMLRWAPTTSLDVLERLANLVVDGEAIPKVAVEPVFLSL